MHDPDPLHIVSIGPAHPLRGGIAQFNEEFAWALAQRGHRLELISFSRQYPSLLFPGRTQTTDEPPARALERHRAVDSVNPLSWLRAAGSIRRQRPDLVLIHYWMPFLAPALGGIARRLRRGGVRTAGIVHNALPHERRRIDPALGRFFFNSCDALVTLSPTVSADLEALGVRTPLVAGRHPRYAQFGEAMPRRDALEKLGLKPGGPLLLFFGFVRKYKGLRTLLEAMPRIREALPEVRLIVAGEFYEDRGPYDDMIRQSGLAGRVEVRDRFIPTEEVRLLFSAADLVVQPYLSATQSGVGAIASAFERPIIATRVGGLAEEIEGEGVGLVVSPGDPSELAAAVVRFFEENLGVVFAPRLRERNAFGWEDLAGRIERLAQTE
jgi:D-inositol-3-phosphate glycosyltransferase